MEKYRDLSRALESFQMQPMHVQGSIGALLLLTLVTVIVVSWLERTSKEKVDFPIVGSTEVKDFRPILEEGTKRYPNSPFIIPTTMHDIIVLPISAVEEIKRLPESQISLRKHHYEVFQGQYTKFGTDTDELDAAIRIDLTRRVDKILLAFQDEVEYAFSVAVGTAETPTAVTVYPRMLKVIALLSSRVFVGLPLSRNDEWLKTVCSYSMAVANGAHNLAPYPAWIRPIIAPFMLTELKRAHASAAEMLGPILAKYKDADMSSQNVENLAGSEGGDFIGYILSHYKRTVTPEQLGLDQLIATFAALHTTTIALTQVIFELAQRPCYVEPLREEIFTALGSRESRLPQFNKDTIHSLRKMDSFIKETQRVNPPSLITMHRIVTDPEGLRLKSGHRIPLGHHIGVPNHLGNISHPDQDQFIGFRWSDMRDQPGQETAHQWVTTGLGHLNFGHGSHSCPGRFFAANEIKVALSYVLLNYDICYPEGETRPENIHTNTIVLPSESAQVLFKYKRRDE
ncbi:uncharacterized protein Z518_00655 [Rhinocladiella mackenziei CBS 650.93]|uniref:Uncharacterized protein n=1 Tax=Rhinocladiella mackenziei CBS 650.93 TaxID=1442369 RepID=A0A0D2JJI1_9EURO|nr:uncharacterized protein Z518_00655 [Rhinocladiella mackenziei CBS 650.93]KIX09575.1 hypothetical protein Z518_00655 [Rhinocladiella mackenziei CBS 650.93]